MKGREALIPRTRCDVRVLIALAGLAAAGAGAGCKLTRGDTCALPDTSMGTYRLMRDGASAAVCPPTLVVLDVDTALTGVEQLRVKATPLTFVVDQAPEFPSEAAGPLAESESLAVELDASMDGVPVTFTVTGLAAGRAVAAGVATAAVNAANIVVVEVALVTCARLDGALCASDGLHACDDDGLEAVAACPYGCNDTRLECNDCTPSTSECHASTAVVCGADGLWQTWESCTAMASNPNRHCDGGICVDF
jgi:hypothetical protein